MGEIVTAAGIGAGANLAGGLIGAALSARGARKADAANRAMIEKQLAWEREKFNTAHQVEVRDLKAAGINPILTAGGSGATAGGITPIASEAASGYNNAGNLVSGSINESSKLMTEGVTESKRIANETAQTASAISKATQEIENMKEEINNWKIERELNKANTGLARETAKQVKESTANLKVEREAKQYEIDMLKTLDPETRALTEMGLEILDTGANVVGAIGKINMSKGTPKAKKKAKKAVKKAAQKRSNLNYTLQIQPRM